MGVTFGSYQIARSGLVTNERGLQVTGHNISNVNTTGFVRQQAILENAYVQSINKGYGIMQMGYGSNIQEIRQIRNTFLDNIYRQESTALGYWDARNSTLQDIESIMAEPLNDSGLQSVLNQFWNSWQELSKDPDSLTVRALVRERAEALVQSINYLGEQLDELQGNLNNEIAERVDEVNSITKAIAELNVTILRSEAGGNSANDYRDQRNVLLDRLSQLVKADVTEMQDGQINVTIGGHFVVQQGKNTELVAEARDEGDDFYVVKLRNTNIEVNIKSGIIKGLMESRGEVSGILGSYENGTPNTTADIVFFVDNEAISDSDPSAKIKAYTDELKKKGINANIIIKNLGVDTSGNIVPVDLETIKDAVEGLDTTSFREGSNRYAFIITDDTSGDFADLKAALDEKGLETSVITDDPSAWSAVIGGTDGKTYSLADFNDGTKFADELRNIAADTNDDINENISVIGSTKNIVSDMRQRLNALVNVMLREINYIHSSGMNMKDPPEQGEDFFVTINSARPLEMGNIMLNPNLSDLSNIVSSRNGENGDNSIARELANLRNKDFIKDTTGILSLDGYYQSIILTMGNKSAEAAGITESQKVLVEAADNSRTSISGVSMDEELSNMMKYKFAYDAAARALNVIDSMLDKVINGTGIVGR